MHSDQKVCIVLRKCYTLERKMGKVVLKRTNLLLEEGKVSELRRRLRARSNSEAVRMAIDRELAAKEALAALRSLRERGTLEDVFHRLRSDHK